MSSLLDEDDTIVLEATLKFVQEYAENSCEIHWESLSIEVATTLVGTPVSRATREEELTTTVFNCAGQRVGSLWSNINRRDQKWHTPTRIMYEMDVNTNWHSSKRRW